MIYFVGFTSKALENAGAILPVPTAPKNYKDALKIKEYVEKERASQIEEAAQGVIAAQIDKWHILNREGNTAMSGASSASFLNELGKLVFAEGVSADYAVGLDIKRAMQLAIAESKSFGSDEEELPGWAVFRGEPYDTFKRLVDPRTVLFGTSKVDELAVAARYSLDPSLLQSAEGRAQLAVLLSVNFPSVWEG